MIDQIGVTLGGTFGRQCTGTFRTPITFSKVLPVNAEFFLWFFMVLETKWGFLMVPNMMAAFIFFLLSFLEVSTLRVFFVPFSPLSVSQFLAEEM